MSAASNVAGSPGRARDASQIRLRVSGSQIVDGGGCPVLLRGTGIGGWLNMENFITGYPSTESSHRDALRSILGEEKYTTFFDRFLNAFFTDGDTAFLAEHGMNLLRIPINYRHLESDTDPFTYLEEGFRRLDRAIDACARFGIYVILDLHALPGYQNQAWHSDNPIHRALYWDHPHFQERTEGIWREIARRYKDNPWIAGYNPINEPGDPGGARIEGVYRRLAEVIRTEDPDRILFLEGNTYSREFDMFTEVIPNAVYTNHDYALAGFVDAGPYPGYSRGEYIDRTVLEETFLRRSEFMLSREMPIWVGEFGPVYTGEEETDRMRYDVLRDQLEIYDSYGVHWAIWTYKDIGLQGLVTVPEDSPWTRRIAPVLDKKRSLGADRWGGTDEGIRDVLQPLEALMEREFPAFHPYPFGRKWLIHRLVRHILISEALVEEFAEQFRGTSIAELEAMADSFHFDNCTVRRPLVQLLSQHAR